MPSTALAETPQQPVNPLAVRYEVDGQAIDLNPDVVMNYLLDDKTMGTISTKEMARVIMTLKARRLDPFSGDVVLQPRTNKDGTIACAIVTTRDFFSRRADANPKYKGKKSGVTIMDGAGVVRKREGSAVYKTIGEQLLGGWCAVYIDGREYPEYAEVSLDEYDTKYALWKSKPGTMICKVSESQALRAAFPNDFNGIYEPEEMGVDISDDTTKQQAPEEIPGDNPNKPDALLDNLRSAMKEAKELGILISDPDDPKAGLMGYIHAKFGREPKDMFDDELMTATAHVRQVIADKKSLAQAESPLKAEAEYEEVEAF